MLEIRKSADRGVFKNDWLHSHHTFSFGEYNDLKHMGFATLRVINEDVVQPNKGFETHSHHDMEIISYVLAGELAHEDSMGNKAVIKAGEVQRMSAGTGVTHSEFNNSSTELVHFLQIWFFPEARGLDPAYEQKLFPLEERQNLFKLVVSKNDDQGSVSLNQDVNMWLGSFVASHQTDFAINPQRKQWVHIIKGEVSLNGNNLQAGDGVSVEDETMLRFENEAPYEAIIFDMG